MSAAEHQPMSWWTPEGWETRPPPEPWVIANSGEDGIDWRQARRAAGYHEMCRFGNTTDYETTADVGVFTCEHDQHLLVELWAADYQLAEFFVSPRHRVAFLVDRLPLLVSNLSSQMSYPSVAEEVRKLRKGVIAFIRHGSGEHVIDDSGETSIDDRRRFAEQQRYEKQRKAAAAAAKAVSS